MYFFAVASQTPLGSVPTRTKTASPSRESARGVASRAEATFLPLDYTTTATVDRSARLQLLCI